MRRTPRSERLSEAASGHIRFSVRFLRTLMTAAVAWSIFQTTGFAQGALTNGENHSGSILVNGEVDTWTFQATTGDAISLSIGEVVDNGGFVPWIRLIAPNASQLGSGFGSLVGQIDILSAPQTGTYTVLAASGDAGATGKGTYRLTLAQWPGTFVVPSNDEGGPMTNGDNHAGTIHLGDLDQWSFQATAGDAISLSIAEVTDGGSFTPWIRLRAPNGAQVGSGFGTLVGQIDIASASQTGTYTVLVSSGDAARAGTGTYRLTLAKSPGTFIVPAGDDGGALTNGVTSTGSIPIGDLDQWTFQANAGNAISLSVGEISDLGGFTPWIRLRAPNGAELGSGFGTLVGQIDILSAPQTGTYTVLVTSGDASNSGTGNYRLTLATWPGSQTFGDEGGPMTNGENHTGTITTGDLDLWWFQANVGDAISLSIGEVVDSGGFTPWIRLRAPNGAQLDSGFGTLVGQIDVLTAPQTGLYSVVVTSGDAARSGTGTYRLTLAKSPGAFFVPADDEGGAMTNGDNHLGTIHLGDLDQWTFQANVGDAISLSIGEVTDTGGFVPWIRLRAPNGAELDSGFGTLVGQVDIATAPQTGTYTVLVTTADASRSGTGTYRLTLAKSPGSFIVPVGDEGGSMTNGANHPGTILMGDLDQWTFNANVGDAIALSAGEVADTGGFVPWIRLRAPNGAELGSGFGTVAGQIDVLSAPQVGTYTVVVSSGDASRSGTGTYRLTLAKTPGSFVVQSGDEGGALKVGPNNPGAIHLADLDQWTLQASVGQNIVIVITETADTGGFTPWIRLRAPNGAQLGSVTGASTAQINIASAPQSGTYTVVVGSGDAARAGTGTYSVNSSHAGIEENRRLRSQLTSQ